MPWLRSLSSTTRFASLRVLVAGGLVLGAAALLRGEDARACVGGEPTITDETTFDPSVIGAATWPGLFFDPYVQGFGGACDACGTTAMFADWHAYLGGAVTDDDWKGVLFDASDSDLSAMLERVDGKQLHIPKGFEQSSIWKKSVPVDRLRAALRLARLVRRVEAVDTFDAGYDQRGNPLTAAVPSPELLADAKAGLAATGSDVFIKQRYAFQVLRVLFYRHDWAAATSFFDTSAAVLQTPSTDLGWRARYYYAGALMRDNKRARANLELARIAADDLALAGAAMRDFKPMEDADWKKSLALAQTTRDKTALWRMVGIKTDALTGVREILKLDPKSNLVSLLIVRELARLESVGNGYGGGEPDAVAAQKKGYAGLEQLAASLASTPTTEQPWVMDLVVAHIAAARGDVATTRARAQKALAARPNDTRVASQAKASLALALVLDWKINPAHEEELAKLMAAIELDKAFGRTDALRTEVRGKLAKAYAAAGKLVDAELLVPGTLVPIDEFAGRPLDGTYDHSKWSEVAFVKEMIARLGIAQSDFDKFVLRTSITRPQLERDLALRYLLDGDFAMAAKTFGTSQAAQAQLHTDPFVLHILDCHDCDHDKYANAPWTTATFVAKLVALAKTANGSGEAAAQASLELGVGLYNITWYGNARVVADESHEQTFDTAQAEHWFKRAFDLTKDRELKAKAAYFAAKCERGRLVAQAARSQDRDASDLQTPAPITPRTWYGVLQQYAGTKYYKEVLKECGYFSTWVAQGGK